MQNNIRSTRAIVETGLMAAIIMVFMIIRTYIPFVEVIAFFLLPVPITLTYIRHGLKYAIASLVISTILGIMFINPMIVIVISVTCGLVGLTLGYCVYKNREFSFTLMLLSFAFAIGIIINMVILTTFIYKGGFIAFINTQVKVIQESINMAGNVYSSLGVNKQQIDVVLSPYKMFTTDFVLKLLPATLVAAAVIYAFLSYVITKAVFKKLRIEMAKAIPFTKLYIPTIFSALMILAIGLGMFLSSRKLSAGDYIIYSSYTLFTLILTIIGASAAAYFLMYRYKMKKGAVTSIIIMVLLILPILLIYLGVAETIFDFRKIDPNRPRRKLED
ncbi:MAG: DUF2232 domain-containing protein [Bacillota bacterium]|nr:DUF2232 domain-containing protein [Bacillota bacterium]